MNIYKGKPRWLTEPLWRALRTFIQTLIPAMGFFITDYAASRVWSWQELWFVVVVPALAATFAWLSNQIGGQDETNI